MKPRQLSSAFQNAIFTGPSGTQFVSLLIDLMLVTLGLLGAILFLEVQMDPLGMDVGGRGEMASDAGASASRFRPPATESSLYQLC